MRYQKKRPLKKKEEGRVGDRREKDGKKDVRKGRTGTEKILESDGKAQKRGNEKVCLSN